MRIKFKHAFIAVIAIIAMSIGLSNCTKNNSGVDSNVEEGNIVTGYFSVAVSTPKSTQTRTEGENNETTVTPNDGDINSVTLILTDDNGKVQQFFTNVSVTSDKTNPVKVATGIYDVYAIVNPSGSIASLLTTGADINTLIQAGGAEEINDYANASSKGFFMINANDNTDKTDNSAWQNVSIETANIQTNPKTISINVDRLVAAIRSEVSATPLIKTGSSLDNAIEEISSDALITSLRVDGIYPLNILNKYNPIQTWIANPDANSDGGKVLSTPTPLQTATAEIASNFYNRPSQIATYDATSKQAVSTSLSGNDFTGLKFVLENRPVIVPDGSNLTTYDNIATGVIFKVTALDASNSAKTFYKVRATDRCYYDKEAAITALNIANGSNIPTTESNLVLLRAAGLQIYEDGAMYFTYYIKDQNYKASYPASAITNALYYAIHRNSVYDLTVTVVSNFGADLPGGDIISPEDPDIIADTYLQVTIVVNQWVDNNIEVEF